MQKDSEIREMFQEHKSDAEKGLGKQYRNIKEMYALYTGERLSNLMLDTRGRKEELVSYNRIKPFVRSVKGFLRQAAPHIKYIPAAESPELRQQGTKYINDLYKYCRRNANADYVESQQDTDFLVTGIGAVDTAMAFGDGYASHDPNGEIVKERVHPLDLMWDPFARAPNLLDARWVARAKTYAIEDALDIFEGSEEEDFDPMSPVMSDPEFYPGGGDTDKIAVGYESGAIAGQIKVYHYQWCEVEPYWRAVNPLYKMQNKMAAMRIAQTLMLIMDSEKEDRHPSDVDDLYDFNPMAPVLIMSPSLKKDIQEIFALENVPFKPEKYKKKVYYSAILSGKKVFTKYKNIDQSGFTIKFKTGDFNDQDNKWTGMVNQLRDPQLYFNKALTELMDIIASNSKGGVLVEEGAVEDLRDFEETYGLNDSAVLVNDGALSGGKIQPKATPQMSTGYEGIISLSQESMTGVVGLDPSFFGTVSSGNESGTLYAQRVQRAFTCLQDYVDAVTLYREQDARQMISLMKAFAENSPGRMLYITGDDAAAEQLKLNVDAFAEEYSITTVDAPMTTVEREIAKERKMMLADKLALMGVNIYDIVLPEYGFDGRQEMEIKERLQPKPPSPEEMKARADMADIELRGKVADLQKMQAEIQLKQVDAEYKSRSMAKLQADITKTQAQTQRELSETEQKEMENSVLRRAPISAMSINI